jgi:hypothetical protein
MRTLRYNNFDSTSLASPENKTYEFFLRQSGFWGGATLHYTGSQFYHTVLTTIARFRY